MNPIIEFLINKWRETQHYSYEEALGEYGCTFYVRPARLSLQEFVGARPFPKGDFMCEFFLPYVDPYGYIEEDSIVTVLRNDNG